ncbi:TraL conjugative transposon family protein [Seramator thermalis]|uniref:TraL conjugative transposon family protein n=1 Tax=Seramator thermalis TaxID=2496270 RepID=UPI00101CCCBC|nr:TraL conjugative transposon family protein [Seramator thermalis]MDD4661074.1 TraL conjugative transposon family protein [Massilibacteroides sp.]
MIRKLINQVNEWLEDKLRSIVRPLSPDARVIVILTMLLLFGSLSIYMTVSSIYNMGKKSGQQQMQIEHIKRLELEHKQEADSVKQLNDFNYE